jgi:acyl phosphate:glycerol-3-phosphate acyltransferase
MTNFYDGAVVVAWLLLPIVGAFVIGSIPFGVIVGRLLFRSDLRRSGSGNIGAANALRSYGAGAGLIVLVLDALKGFVSAFGGWFWYFAIGGGPLAERLLGLFVFDNRSAIAALIGLTAVLGHCYSPWLKFKGGKGVATFLGTILGISPVVGLIFMAIWLVVVIPTRHASLGSIVASLSMPVVLGLQSRFWLHVNDNATSVIVALAALLIVWKHRENIVRLREGRENKITFGKASA